MKDKVRRQLARRKQRIARRLARKRLGNCSRPVMTAGNVVYEMAERATGTACGGIGAIQALVRELGLAEAEAVGRSAEASNIDERLHVLKLHLPDHESDQVLSLAFNALCFGSGFRSLLLRGDTDFSQTTHLDRWSANPHVQFIFGYDRHGSVELLAEELPEDAWKPLDRPARYQVKTQPRQRPKNVQQQIVDERGYTDKKLVSEWVAEFEYRPTACKSAYRMVVLRKNLHIRDKQRRLVKDYVHFFYITNDRRSTPQQIVFSANDRCNQENLHAQLKGGVRALTAPVDTLTSNGAYMAMTALAWNLKAWYALTLPEGKGPHVAARQEEKQCVGRMEFKTFVNHFIQLPCQVLRTGRRIVCRLLSWNRRLNIFFRWLDSLPRPKPTAIRASRRVAAMRC